MTRTAPIREVVLLWLIGLVSAINVDYSDLVSAVKIDELKSHDPTAAHHLMTILRSANQGDFKPNVTGLDTSWGRAKYLSNFLHKQYRCGTLNSTILTLKDLNSINLHLKTTGEALMPVKSFCGTSCNQTQEGPSAVVNQANTSSTLASEAIHTQNNHLSVEEENAHILDILEKLKQVAMKTEKGTAVQVEKNQKAKIHAAEKVQKEKETSTEYKPIQNNIEKTQMEAIEAQEQALNEREKYLEANQNLLEKTGMLLNPGKTGGRMLHEQDKEIRVQARQLKDEIQGNIASLKQNFAWLHRTPMEAVDDIKKQIMFQLSALQNQYHQLDQIRQEIPTTLEIPEDIAELKSQYVLLHQLQEQDRQALKQEILRNIQGLKNKYSDLYHKAYIFDDPQIRREFLSDINQLPEVHRPRTMPEQNINEIYYGRDMALLNWKYVQLQRTFDPLQRQKLYNEIMFLRYKILQQNAHQKVVTYFNDQSHPPHHIPSEYSPEGFKYIKK